jgi:hypothetical protein
MSGKSLWNITSTLLLVLAFLLCAEIMSLAASAPDIPPGTEIQVRVIENLSSGTSSMGDIFHGTLDEPIVVNGKQLFPKGADVTGTVAAVHASGRLSDPGELNLILNTVSSGGIASSVTVQPLQIKGESHTKSNVTKIGGGGSQDTGPVAASWRSCRTILRASATSRFAPRGEAHEPLRSRCATITGAAWAVLTDASSMLRPFTPL